MNPQTTTEVRLPQRIVVGVDAGGLSDDAVKAGAALADRLGAELDLVHAVRIPLSEWLNSDPARGPAVMARALEAASSRVNDRVRKLLAPDSRRGVGDPVRVCAGSPAAALITAAREDRQGWIVLGRHRKRGPVEFGNTARTVLAKNTVPVWIQVGPERRITRILAPIDLSEDSLRSLSLACSIAKALGAGVRAVHFFDAAELLAGVVPDPLGYAPAVSVQEIRERSNADFDRAISSFDWRGVEHSAEFRDGVAVEGILELSSAADLVAIATHGRTGLSAAVLGGVAHSVLRRSETPVLAIPRPGRAFRI